MDFWGALLILRRRWYVVLPAILGSAALAAVTFIAIPTTYTSTGVAVLTAPALGGTFTESASPRDVAQINPLLAFDGSLNTTSQIIIQILKDPATAERLGIGPSSSDTFEVNNGSVDQRGPFVIVDSTSKTEARAQEIVVGVLDQANRELKQRQEDLNAPPSTFITAQLLVRPTAPEAQIGGKIRFTGAAFMLGFIAALAAPFALESIASRRRRGDDPIDLEDQLDHPEPALPLPPRPEVPFQQQAPVPSTEVPTGVREASPVPSRRARPQPSRPTPRPRPLGVTSLESETVKVPAIATSNGHGARSTNGSSEQSDHGNPSS